MGVVGLWAVYWDVLRAGPGQSQRVAEVGGGVEAGWGEARICFL